MIGGKTAGREPFLTARTGGEIVQHQLTRLFGRIAVFALVIGASIAASPAPPALPVVDEAGTPSFASMGGATPLATDRTVPHWHSQFTDPTNGVTYGYNMVGTADPRSGSAGTTTIGIDLIPLDLHFAANGGYSLNGANEVALTLASPIYAANDYSRTKGSSGGAGELSLGNTSEQYESAVMRSQFDQTGTGYHLNFSTPVVRPTTCDGLRTSMRGKRAARWNNASAEI